MNQLGIALVMIGIAAMGITAPTSAIANDSMPGDMPHLVITVVCTVYSDQLGEVISGMDLALGINLGQYMHGCEMTTEYVDTYQEPDVIVDISEGALFPACVDSNDCFDPPNVTVTAGTEVTWTNSDTVLHTVTEQNGIFNSWLQPGEEFTFTFGTPSTYTYTCTVHPWSTGMVTVEPGDAASSTSNSYPSQAYVEALIGMYTEKGTAAFKEINDNADPDTEVLGFIVDANTYVLVAHNSDTRYLGLRTNLVLDKALVPISDMLDIMEANPGGVWLSYPLPDPQLNILGYERGWFKLHDGYVFSARINTAPDDRSQSVVEEMIRLYHLNPLTTFDHISSFKSTSVHYPFVLDPETKAVVAHGANPARIGATSVVLTNSSVPYDTLRSLEEGEGVWTEYTFDNPATGMEQSKISWIKMYDGYLFGSGYYP